MKIVSIIGKLSDLDKAARLAVMNGSIHILNALSELNSNCLNLKASQEHMETLHELAHIRPYIARRDFTADEAMIVFFHKLFDLKPELCERHLSIECDYDYVTSDLRKVHDNLKDIYEGIGKRKSNIEKLQRCLDTMKYLKNTGIAIDELMNLNFIKFRLMMLSNENFRKLEQNFENVPSVVLQIAAIPGNVIIATFSPEELKEEAERYFASLNYTELEVPQGYSGTAEDVIKQLQIGIKKEEEQIVKLKESVQELKGKYKEEVVRAYTLLELEKKAEKVKQDIAIGHNMFFMFGFVPESEIEDTRMEFQRSFGDSVIVAADDVDARRLGHAPPTKIKNNFLFKPFETLISMYGTPSYGEKDPTPFFAISYMLLFGAMFGDLGQGLVVLLGGLFVSYKLGNKGFGGILARLGASSMVFGALYGSIFGSEEIIGALLIRPMANINTVLIAAIALGIVLTTVSYIYSLMNQYKARNVEEGLFGKEGLAGFLFFMTLVLGILGEVTGKSSFGIVLPLGVMAVLLLIMVFKQPLAGLITGHKLYEGSPGDYYIEAGFGVIETVLSVASNIISFIRVGAFALNHVGLYIAFATMAEMMNSRAGGIAVLVIGNIIIIGLEGLIVFIQSLRLEYYELFSKYYSGYGVEYKPVGLFSEDSVSDVL